MFIRAVLMAAVAGFVLASAPVRAEDPMSGQDILKLAPGTFQAVVKGKYHLVVTLGSDGTVVGDAKGLKDKGRWTVQDDQLCIVMPTWTRGRVECSAVVADSGWYRGRNVAFRPL